MTTSDLTNLIAAILVGGGTLFLGLMAWRAIRQTRYIQSIEKRERLLNEIIEWAVDVLEFSPMPRQSIFALKTKEDKVPVEDAIMLMSASMQERLEPIIAKGAYINRISQTFGKNLGEATNKTAFCLGEMVGCINNLSATRSSIEAVGKARNELHGAAVRIIEEAINIKSKYI